MPMATREEQRAYQRAWMKARRNKYLTLHVNKCNRCASTEDLEFDHVDRKNKVSHRIWSWAEHRIVEELMKCQLLCEACHASKTIEERFADGSYAVYSHGTNGRYHSAVNGCKCPECLGAHAAVARSKYSPEYRRERYFKYEKPRIQAKRAMEPGMAA